MNCLESRRSLLAAPRDRTAGLDLHLSECGECSRLAVRLADLDGSIADAACVPVPQGIADRVLYRRRRLPQWPYAAAAAALFGSVMLGFAAPQIWDASGFSGPLEAVGPSHPAVAAIAMVVEQQPTYLDDGHGIDKATMDVAMKRLGLSFRKDGVKVDYAGRCYMPDTECEHLVLETPDGHVSVILVADYPVGSRAFVADRRMTALVNPIGTGGYIVVAGSPKAAKRTEKLLVKGRV